MRLEQAGVVTTTWGAWKAEHPDTTVVLESLALGRDFDFRNGRDADGPIFPIGDVDPRLPVIPVRALKNKGTEEFTAKQREVAGLVDSEGLEMMEAQLQIEHYWAGALRRAVVDGDVENGSLMAGQSVGMVKAEEPVADIMTSLMDQCEEALSKR